MKRPRKSGEDRDFVFKLNSECVYSWASAEKFPGGVGEGKKTEK